MERKDDPVARSIGHLLVGGQSTEHLRSTSAYAPIETESATRLTPPSTQSSLSIPTTEIESFHTDSTFPPPFPPPGNIKTQFACIKLQLNDQLIVHQFPASTVSLIRETLTANWPRGIQKEEPIDPQDESNAGRIFKLKGNPFFNSPQNTNALGETVPTCRVMAALLDRLSRAGWVLTLSAGSAVGMRQHKPTLIFRYQDPAPAPQQWCVLTILQVGIMDTLRIVDAPQQLYLDLQIELENARMTSRHGRSFDGVYDIELGRFRCTTDNVDVQELMLILLGVLDRHGFTVALSIDQAWDYGKPDTWYCCRASNWTPGLPVFHR